MSRTSTASRACASTVKATDRRAIDRIRAKKTNLGRCKPSMILLNNRTNAKRTRMNNIECGDKMVHRRPLSGTVSFPEESVPETAGRSTRDLSQPEEDGLETVCCCA